MNEAPAHEPYDFSNMPLTNEQKILACLERIEVLLTKPVITAKGLPISGSGGPGGAPSSAQLKASHAEQMVTLANKTMGTRRK
jgi:hypothetical protein